MLKSRVDREFTRPSVIKQIDQSIDKTVYLAHLDIATMLTASEEEEDDEDDWFFIGGYLPITGYVLLKLREFAADIVDMIYSDIDPRKLYKLSRTQLNNIIYRYYENNGKYRANGLSRTIINDIYNSSQLYMMRNSQELYVQFVAVLDERTSQICRMLNGTVFNVNSSEASYFRPPLHPNCRSRLMPYGSKILDTRILYDNRNFANLIDTNMQYGLSSIPESTVQKSLGQIEWFRNYWDMPQYVVETDLSTRLGKMIDSYA
jgi:SPP1 gp7 family putative phage head morphogenesis protein